MLFYFIAKDLKIIPQNWTMPFESVKIEQKLKNWDLVFVGLVWASPKDILLKAWLLNFHLISEPWVICISRQ